MTSRNSEEYRQRAQRARDLADEAKDAAAAEALRRVAADYESMADRVEAQSKHKPETRRER